MMIDYTEVTPGDRVRVTKKLVSNDELGKEITVASIESETSGFYATDGRGYAWSQVEPITDKPTLITRPIEGIPEWLASTPKGVAVKCRAKRVAGESWLSYPVWIVGIRIDENPNGFCYVDVDGYEYDIAEPWTGPEAEQGEKLFTKAEVLEAVEKALEERSKS